MDVVAGSTDVTTYVVLRLAADGTEATGLTITNIDLQYCRSGAAPAAKVDATALAATDTAHTDNYAIEIDATDQPGLYRIDWPDAAFAAGAREVILSVKCATAFTEHIRVNLTPVPADVQNWKGSTAPAMTGDAFARLGAPAGASVSADIAAIEAQTDDIGAAGAGLTAVPWNASWDAEVQSEVADALEAAIADSVPADGTIPSVKQALYMLTQFMLEKQVSGTTVSVKKADGSTELFTLTLNNATNPTSITRAS